MNVVVNEETVVQFQMLVHEMQRIIPWCEVVIQALAKQHAWDMLGVEALTQVPSLFRVDSISSEEKVLLVCGNTA
jgi:hypothetical protein